MHLFICVVWWWYTYYQVFESTIYFLNEIIVFLIIDIHSLSSSSVITSGGENLIMSPCVGLASSPFSLSCTHTCHASKSRCKQSILDLTNNTQSGRQHSFLAPSRHSYLCWWRRRLGGLCLELQIQRLLAADSAQSEEYDPDAPHCPQVSPLVALGALW